MRNFLILWLAILTITTPSFGAVDRTLDAKFITVQSPSNVLTLPSTTDVLIGRNTSDTLTNKSLSGSSNTFTNIPAATAISGQLPVANGGTGASTLTSNGILYGNGTSAVAATAAGSQYQVYQAGSSGVPTVDAVHLDQSAATTGTLPVNRGGTGAASLTANNVILGNGTSAVQFVAPGSSGNVLTSNGSTWSSSAPPANAPALNGGPAAPQSVTAAGGVVLSSLAYENFAWVIGSPGAVTVTATPSVTACTANGQQLHIVGTDATKTVTLQDNAGLAGSNLQLNGTWVGGLYSVLNLHCDLTLGMWVEDSRR